MPRIGIVVVAYNAASTLARVLDRIPPDFRSRIEHVWVGDNHSEDSTYLLVVGYQQAVGDLPITVVRHPRNLGYGGNQKAGYRWAIEQGIDIVVMLHADGQYAPEFLPQIIAPLEAGECDAVFGSRMMNPADARRGGMPLYKFVGNRILTRVQNGLVGEHLSEWHSGYRAYSVDTLRDIPFEDNTDDYNFDTQIIIQLHEAGKRIVELPIPTYYGEEICYVNGMRYAKDCVIDSLRYRAHKMGLGSGAMAFASSDDDSFDDEERVHARVVRWMEGRAPSRVLDLGCGDGVLAARLRALGHTVTGVDQRKPATAGSAFDAFVEADLELGVPDEAGDGYDVVIAIDVLGNLRDTTAFLESAARATRPGGSVIVSVPNFEHWYPRLRVASGRFDYDRRGILDREHIRFFSRRLAERRFAEANLRVRRTESVGLPLDLMAARSAGKPGGRLTHSLQVVDRLGVATAPGLFAYQYLYELGADAPESTSD